MSAREPAGPIEDASWPTALVAHVVDPGPPPRIHGYDAVTDLARHHGPSEIALLAYTGELPDARTAAMFELATSLLAPVAITSAAGHATALARLLAAPHANVVAIAAMVAAEGAERLIAEHAPWLAWCAAPDGPPPDGFTGDGGERAAAVARARLHALGVEVPALAHGDPTTAATALALLHACGLREPLQLVAAIVGAELPCLVAEAQRHVPRRLAEYPIDLPPFDYQEDRG